MFMAKAVRRLVVWLTAWLRHGGANFSPQEAPEDLLALVELDCQQNNL
jgi:hypothetical protein